MKANRYFALSCVVAFFNLSAFNSLFADPIEIYFGPNGGFAEVNKMRTITSADGSSASATLSQALIERINAAESKSKVKICSYSMSEMPALDALIKAVERGVQVRLLLDASAEWTSGSREKIMKRLKSARAAAQESGMPFDIQVRFVTSDKMRDRNRTKVLRDGRTIVGTMHEKFGLFYPPASPVPLDGFCGSANISPTSDKIYAENRIFFKNRPVVLRQLQEEFARLWNEYGVVVFGPASSEAFIPVDPPIGDVAMLFNAEPLDETALTRIDETLLRIIRSVGVSGSLDLVMFSLTDRDLAFAILDQAARCPNATFRLLLDMGQIDDSNPESGILAPQLEREIVSRRLKNVEIRYKWRSNAIGLDPETQKLGIVSFRNLFLHHKLLVINKNYMAIGSYNWSGAGEEMNFEDLMLFDGRFPDHQPVIDRVSAEMEAVWNAQHPQINPAVPFKNVPRVVTGQEGRQLMAKIIALLRDSDNRAILERLDRRDWVPFDSLREELKMPASELKSRLDALVAATLLCRRPENNTTAYTLAD